MPSSVIKINLPDSALVLVFGKANDLNDQSKAAIREAECDDYWVFISKLKKDHIDFVRERLPDKPSHKAFANRLFRKDQDWQKAVDMSFNKTVHPWANKPSCS